MTTIPAQTGDLSVTRKATREDATLLLQVVQVFGADGAGRGSDLLYAEDRPTTYDELERRHPRGSEERRAIEAFLASCETIGTFVKHGLIDRPLVDDLFWVTGAWERCRGICLGAREKYGEPRLFENFEALAASV